MSAFARAMGLTVALGAVVLVWGCNAGPDETDETSDVDVEDADEDSADLDEPESEAVVCLPTKIPICGWGQTTTCEGAGTCRRCWCSNF